MLKKIFTLNVFLLIFSQSLHAQNSNILLFESDFLYVNINFKNDSIMSLSYCEEQSEKNVIGKYKISNDTLCICGQKDFEIFENIKIFVSKDIEKTEDSVNLIFYCLSSYHFLDDNDFYSRIAFDSMYVEINEQKYYLNTDSNNKYDCKFTNDVFSVAKIKKETNSWDLRLYRKNGDLVLAKTINIKNKNAYRLLYL